MARWAIWQRIETYRSTDVPDGHPFETGQNPQSTKLTLKVATRRPPSAKLNAARHVDGPGIWIAASG
jgi:hypothetical protein